MKKMEKGFTLVELMIVVAIIAILAAVAVPSLGTSVNKAKDSKALAALGSARTNLTTFWADIAIMPDADSGKNLWRGGNVNSNTGSETAAFGAVAGFNATTDVFDGAGATNKPKVNCTYSDAVDTTGNNIAFIDGVDTKKKNWNSY